MIFLVSMCFLGLVSSSRLPSYFPVCHVDDPKLNKCLVDAANSVKPYLIRGVKELNLPSISPLYIPEINMEQGTRAVNFKLHMKNAKIDGMETYKFLEMNYNPKTLDMDGFTTFDGLKMTTNYTISGNVLLAPIEGKGIFHAVLGPCNGSLHLKGELRKENGVPHYHIKSSSAKIQLSEADGTFDGLFNGNKQLSDATNRVLQDNTKEIIHEVLPSIEHVAAELLKNLMQNVNRILPYEDYLPPLKKH